MTNISNASISAITPHQWKERCHHLENNLKIQITQNKSQIIAGNILLGVGLAGALGGISTLFFGNLIPVVSVLFVSNPVIVVAIATTIVASGIIIWLGVELSANGTIRQQDLLKAIKYTEPGRAQKTFQDLSCLSLRELWNKKIYHKNNLDTITTSGLIPEEAGCELISLMENFNETSMHLCLTSVESIEGRYDQKLIKLEQRWKHVQQFIKKDPLRI